MRYWIPAGGQFETVVKKSRFVCTVRAVDSVEVAKAAIAEVSAAFSDASHNCWAYKVGGPDDHSRLGCSDDGEPKGTAGRPMLTILTHAEVGDVLVVVTRYFGGTKLGTGGLVKAYGDSVKDALQQVSHIEKIARTTRSIRAPYSFVETLKRGFPDHEAHVTNEIFAADVTFQLAIPNDRLHAFQTWIDTLRDVQLTQS